MKKKRYYCDWAMSKPSNRGIHILLKLLFISFLVVTVVSGVVCYNIEKHNLNENFEKYYENAYNYLDDIADNVIEKNGINVAAIPDDIVEYEINYKDDVIIFKYSVDRSKDEGIIDFTASMTVTLSKDFEVLSKEHNFSSKKEFIASHMAGIFIVSLIFGIFTWGLLIIVICTIMSTATIVSMLHKEINIRRYP